MLSFGIDTALALAIASRRREFAAGSGMPCLAAMVMSRDSLEKALERIPSWRSLRNWMFLNFECPAMARFLASSDFGRKRGALMGLPLAHREITSRRWGAALSCRRNRPPSRAV